MIGRSRKYKLKKIRVADGLPSYEYVFSCPRYQGHHRQNLCGQVHQEAIDHIFQRRALLFHIINQVDQSLFGLLLQE